MDGQTWTNVHDGQPKFKGYYLQIPFDGPPLKGTFVSGYRKGFLALWKGTLHLQGGLQKGTPGRRHLPS